MKHSNNFFAFLCVATLVILSVTSCHKDDNPNPYNDNNNNNNEIIPDLKFLSIVDATTVYISSSASLKRNTAENDNKLFKITESGYVEEVSYLDEDGNTIVNSQPPTSLCNLSSDYLTVTFYQTTYLVRKSDGAVFVGDKLPISFQNQSNYRPDLMLQYDGQGNIYYKYNRGYDNPQSLPVYKLNVTDPNNLSVSLMTASGDGAWSFCVDNAGNMIYNGYGATNPANRYRHAAGNFQNIPQMDVFWTDINNDTIYSRNGNSMYLNIQQITPSPFEFKTWGDSTYSINCINFLVKLKSKNKVIGEGCGFLFELYNTEKQPKKIENSTFNLDPNFMAKMFVASNNYLYLLGNSMGSSQVALKKINPDDYSYTDISIPTDFETYSIVVSPDDEIQLYALRLSDGKRVLAEIINNSLEILKVLDNETVSYLERIN